MRRFLLSTVFQLSIVGAALSQAQQPATFSVLPTMPEVLRVLDKQGNWVPMGVFPPNGPYNQNGGIELQLVRDYKAVCDGNADDTVPIQNWLFAAQANTVLSAPSLKTCVFKSNLVFPNKNYVTFLGNGATFLYQGSDVVDDLITWGVSGHGCSFYNAVIRDFTIKSTAQMMGGAGIHFKDACRLVFDNVTAGPILVPGGGLGDKNLYNGLQFEGGNQASINNLISRTSYAQEVISGDTTANGGYNIVDYFHNNVWVTGGKYGLLIGGGCGGCYWDNTDTLEHAPGANVRIDQSQTPRIKNAQIRFGPNFGSDGGGSVLGVDLQDWGASQAPPTATAAGAFPKGAMSITLTSCPTIPSDYIGATYTEGYIFDQNLIPPRMIALTYGVCSGNVLTLISPTTSASAGVSDVFEFGAGGGPGRTGSELACIGCWLSTTANNLNIVAGSQYHIQLLGARIMNNCTDGVTNNSDLIRMEINGGRIAQCTNGLVNNAAGANIYISVRPEVFGNTHWNAGTGWGPNANWPTIISGCGGADAQIFGDDWDWQVGWGSTPGNTCDVAFGFQHDNIPTGAGVTLYGSDNYANIQAGSLTTTGVQYNFHLNMSSGMSFRVHMSGWGF